MSSLKNFLLLFLLLLSISAEAKKAPKWKPRNFKTTASGLQYSICKTGKGDSIRMQDVIWPQLFRYERKNGKLVVKQDPKAKEIVPMQLGDGRQIPGIIEAIQLLRKGGSGFFILPPSPGKGKDTIYTFIRITEVAHLAAMPDSVLAPPPDTTVQFVVTDPAQDNYGDSLFTTMKLQEVPTIISCGRTHSWTAFRFQLTWFDNGVQRKDILVYIECPDSYGANYFVAGKSYVITAIPLTENRKEGKAFYNRYSGEKLETYLCLRVAAK